MRRLALVALAVVAAAALGGARPARAYVRYVSAGGAPFIWQDSCVPVVAYPADLAVMMPADQVMAAAAGAAAAWSAVENDTSLLIQVAAANGATPAAKYDGQNSLVFRASGWCKSADEAGACTYDPSALAITNVFARSDGQIVDADIEVNATYFTWADLTGQPPPGPDVQDLQNALTHEMGHLIGLDHPCIIPGNMLTPALDNLGDPEPSCDVASPSVKEATMYPSSAPGDISKRTLAADDVLAVHQIYPPLPGAPGPRMCPAPVAKIFADRSGGCALSGGGAHARAGALAACAGAFAWCARRRRRRGRAPVSPRDGS